MTTQHQPAVDSASKPGGRGRYPDFFIIGASKSGTTALHDFLSNHPDLWMSSFKEPNYFDPNPWPNRHDPALYHALFEGAREDQLCAESSTNYTMWPQAPRVPRAISRANPNARFIYLLREPIQRCYSHLMHRHEREVLREQPYRMTFEEYVAFDPRVVDASDYGMQLRQYLDYYPREAFLLLPFERYIKDTPWALKTIFGFLGVEDRSEEIAGAAVKRNQRDNIKEHMTRYHTVSGLKRIPGLQAVYDRMPKGLRDASIALAGKSPLGRRARVRLTPPPILPETRKRLQERYDASAAFLESEFGFDTSIWKRRSES